MRNAARDEVRGEIRHAHRDLCRARTRTGERVFHRVDQQLLQKLREQAKLKADEKALAAATGIEDQQTLDELIAVGVRVDTLHAFRMFPAIYIAWCDRVLDTKERDAILSAVDQVGFRADTPAYHLIGAWLKQRPGPELLAAWKDYVASLAEILSSNALENLRTETLGTAHRVAEAAGGLLGIMSVSANEKEALQELEAAFTPGDKTSKATP